jgi:hypothetical protein
VSVAAPRWHIVYLTALLDAFVDKAVDKAGRSMSIRKPYVYLGLAYLFPEVWPIGYQKLANRLPKLEQATGFEGKLALVTA